MSQRKQFRTILLLALGLGFFSSIAFFGWMLRVTNNILMSIVCAFFIYLYTGVTWLAGFVVISACKDNKVPKRADYRHIHNNHELKELIWHEVNKIIRNQFDEKLSKYIQYFIAIFISGMYLGIFSIAFNSALLTILALLFLIISGIPFYVTNDE